MIFETDRLIVRKFTREDSEAFFGLNGDVEVMRYIRLPKNRHDCDTFLLENVNLYRNGSVIGRYAVAEKATGIVIGMFSLLYLSGDADFHIGYALLPSEWGKGYATEITKKGVAWFFEHTDKTELFAITDRDNEALKKYCRKLVSIKKKNELNTEKRCLSSMFLNRPPEASDKREQISKIPAGASFRSPVSDRADR